MLAGLRPSSTPLAEWCDASWAALAEFLGPGEHIPETWEQITGDEVTVDGGGGEAAGEGPERAATRGGDQSLAKTIANLSDDDLEKWVPAFTNPNISDDEFDRGWRRSSKFAAGQAGALKLGGNAGGKRAAATEGGS